MPVQIRTLKVRPNPWIDINSRGLPSGRVAHEQPAGGFDSRTVGTSITNVVKVQDAPKGIQLAQADHIWDVEAVNEDVLVPNTAYYRRRIMKGELIAADRATFVAAGGSAKEFEEHGKLIEQIKADAIVAFDAANGEGAFLALEQQRAEDKQLAEEVKKAAGADQEPKLLKHDKPSAEAIEKTQDVIEKRAAQATAHVDAKKGDS